MAARALYGGRLAQPTSGLSPVALANLEVVVKHLKITFVDGSEEELEAKYDRARTADGVLLTTSNEGYTTRELTGPSYPLVNIKKYEWVEGYK